MSIISKLEKQIKEAPGWEVYLLILASTAAGALTLWATWYFYKDFIHSINFRWFHWIQPALMVLASLMGFIAAALMALRKPEGLNVLMTALSIFPVILALRLVIVVLRFIVYIGDWVYNNSDSFWNGTFFDQIRVSPRSIAITAVILLIVLLLNILKSKETPKENK